MVAYKAEARADRVRESSSTFGSLPYRETPRIVPPPFYGLGSFHEVSGSSAIKTLHLFPITKGIRLQGACWVFL
jgi:hypothetical protein